MTRRFEIGPLLIALAAIVLIVALFLRWYGAADAWAAFEIADLLLAVLAVACLAVAVALVVPELPGPEPRVLPWLVGAVVVIVAAELINPPPTVAVTRLGVGAWIAFGSACVMVVGAFLTVGRVSLAVAVEGRDLRRRVPAVDHRPAPTEHTAPTAPARPRPSEPLLAREETETTEEA
jgi:exosortase/archaeosortase